MAQDSTELTGQIPSRALKRSRSVRLTTMGVMASGAMMVSGCGEDAPAPKATNAKAPGETEVQAFDNVFDCKANSKLSEAECRDAHSKAMAATETEAPRFEAKENCEDAHGLGGCIEQKATGGGGSFFIPFMAGYLVSKMAGGGHRYAPLYKRAGDESKYTGSGHRLRYGGTAGRFLAGGRALETPRSAPKIKARTAVVSRGGFGERSANGWNMRSSGSSLGG